MEVASITLFLSIKICGTAQSYGEGKHYKESNMPQINDTCSWLRKQRLKQWLSDDLSLYHQGYTGKTSLEVTKV